MTSPTRTPQAPLPEWKRWRYPQSLYRWVALVAVILFVRWTLEVLRIDLERLPGLFERIGTVDAANNVNGGAGLFQAEELE